MTEYTYEAVYARWLADPEAFWADAAKDVHWFKSWDKILDDSRAPLYQWFAGAEVNSCYNALDLHLIRFVHSRHVLVRSLSHPITY